MSDYKSIEVSVINRGSKIERIQIEMNIKTAELFLQSHSNITACIKSDVSQALKFINRDEYKV